MAIRFSTMRPVRPMAAGGDALGRPPTSGKAVTGPVGEQEERRQRRDRRRRERRLRDVPVLLDRRMPGDRRRRPRRRAEGATGETDERPAMVRKGGIDVFA